MQTGGQYDVPNDPIFIIDAQALILSLGKPQTCLSLRSTLHKG